eukprot:XP_011682651.1 PREDICTED: uncharacterized protein LOC105446926 [Strongylocentrotus purpuratus]
MRRTSYTMDGFCLLYLLMILLMRSGDVETNPGPDSVVSEKELLRLSQEIEPSFYKELGINLDISTAELGQIKEHSQNTSDALMTVFTRWRDKQPQGTNIRALLAEELESSNLVSLSGEILAGSLVPNRTGIPPQSKSNEESSSATPKSGPLPSTDNFDDILVAIAKRVRQDSEIDTLGKKLKFSPEDIQGYIATNHKTQNVTYDGTLQMLRDWRKGQRNSTVGKILKTALEQSGQIRLADDLFPSS